MENVEKYTVVMLVGPCSQHVTGNTSRLNQPQSAIMHIPGWHFDVLLFVVFLSTRDAWAIMIYNIWGYHTKFEPTKYIGKYY